MTTRLAVFSILPWAVFLIYAGLVLLATPRQPSEPAGFFAGRSRGGQAPGVLLLGVSAAISWVMAKSVNNAMNLAADFGLLGGIAYAAYWLAFIVVGVAIYFMRTRGGFESLASFLRTKYGARATRLFLMVIAIRLFNEVWSNTKIAALYFGDEGSTGYWIAAAGLTLLTLYYSLKGGLRSSIVTDGLQMILLLVLLIVTLTVIAPDVFAVGLPVSAGDGITPTMQAGGLTFLGLALVQTLSYGFHDPVLTDRAFVNAPARMVASFVIAAVLGGVCIVGFSTVGLYALTHDIVPVPSVAVAVPLAIGVAMLLLFNAVMLASAGSTLDSVMTSTAKFHARDWPMAEGVSTTYQQNAGRRAMWFVALVGNLPLLSIYITGVGPAVIAATTISGTAIMGLAPIFLLGWIKRAGKVSFHLALWPGVVIGVLLALEDILRIQTLPDFIAIGSGPYAETLGINVYGVLLCTALFIGGSYVRPRRGLL